MFCLPKTAWASDLIRVGHNQAAQAWQAQQTKTRGNMKLNAWTVGLIGAGLVSLPAVMQAEERTNAVLSALSSTTISEVGS